MLSNMIQSTPQFVTFNGLIKIKLTSNKLSAQLIWAGIVRYAIPIKIQHYPGIEVLIIYRILPEKAPTLIISAPSH